MKLAMNKVQLRKPEDTTLKLQHKEQAGRAHVHQQMDLKLRELLVFGENADPM